MGAIERLENLRKRQAQIAAQLAALEAREKADRRKAETRRKIILGAAVLKLAERNPDFARWMDTQLPTLLGERDRRVAGRLVQSRARSS